MSDESKTIQEATGSPVSKARASKRLYIAGPMTGYPEFNYPAFHAAKQALLDAGYEVRSPADHELADGLEWADYMRKDIPWLLECDAVAVLPGWTGSRGASLEVYIAGALDMRVRDLWEWLRYAEDAALALTRATPSPPASASDSVRVPMTESAET